MRRDVDIPNGLTTGSFARCLIFKSSVQICTVTFYIITTPILGPGNTAEVAGEDFVNSLFRKDETSSVLFIIPYLTHI